MTADCLTFVFFGRGCSPPCALPGVCVSLPMLWGALPGVPAGGCSAAGEVDPLASARCLVCGFPSRPAGHWAPGTLAWSPSVPSGRRAEPAWVPGSALSTALGGREWWAHPVLVACPCGPGPARRSPTASRLCPGTDRVPPAGPACRERASLLLPSVQAPPRPLSTLVCASRLARLPAASPGSRSLASSAFVAASPLVAPLADP